MGKPTIFPYGKIIDMFDEEQQRDIRGIERISEQLENGAKLEIMVNGLNLAQYGISWVTLAQCRIALRKTLDAVYDIHFERALKMVCEAAYKEHCGDKGRE